MSIKENLEKITASLPETVTLIAVTKTHPVEKLQELYEAGHRYFGENKVQEMVDKYHLLPKDIQWHLIGHLQTNKVKFIAPFVTLIHSVDSFKLLQEINKQAEKNNRVIDCLLQVYIAKEETKFGLDAFELDQLINSETVEKLPFIAIRGLMGMASNTENKEQIAAEFRSLTTLFHSYQSIRKTNIKMEILSMGMSSDYEIAVQNGSNMIRVGSSLFGKRA
jgi:pyridoxal phosphate enzyme (YggS family)